MRHLLLLAVMVLSAVQLSAQSTIASARTQPAGSTVTVSGIVTTGPEFAVIRFMQDGTAGIAVYSSQLSNVEIGDSIIVTGQLKDYNNLLEIDPVSSVTIISSNNPLPAPKTLTLTQAFSEAYEAQLVKVSNVQFTSSGNFTISGSGVNFDITDGTTTAEVRIHSGTNIAGTPIPSGNVSITGVMSQFHSTYQMLPRSLDDIETAGPKFTSSLMQENINVSSFDISFTTENPGNTIIRYGTTPALGQVATDAALVTNHSISLSGLSPATMYYVQALSIGSSNDTSFSAVEVMATQSLSSGDIKVYFTKPVDNSVSTGTNAVWLNNAMADTIIAYIDRAQQTLDLAIYNMDNNNGIVTALNNAYNRGVAVRVIADEGINNSAWNALNIGPGNKKKSPSGQAPGGGYYGIMHNKFMIIDADAANPNQPIIFTGSTNFTDGQVTKDPNNLIVFQDQSLARAYELEFEEMWGGTFGPMKANNTPHLFRIGNRMVELYFSPSDAPEDRLKQTIYTTDSDLHFAIFAWTRYNIAYDLRDEYNAGAFVAGVVQDTGSGGGQAIQIIGGATPQTIFVDNQPGIMHHKYLIVDAFAPASDPLVFTGSYNWSSSGATRNDENFVIVHDATIANIYYQEWRKRYTDNGGTLFAGIESNPEIEVLVYPNPANDVFTIASPVASEKWVRVFDLSGKIIHEEVINGRTGHIQVGQWPNGVYLLQLEGDGGTATKKIIKH